MYHFDLAQKQMQRDSIIAQPERRSRAKGGLEKPGHNRTAMFATHAVCPLGYAVVAYRESHDFKLSGGYVDSRFH